MPRTIKDRNIKETRGATLTGKLIPATDSNRRIINFRQGFDEVLFEPEDQPMRVGFAARIDQFLWYDDSKAVGSQFSDLLGDNKAVLDSAQTGIVTATLAAADALYFGFTGRVAGVDFDLTSLNNNTSAAMTVQYSNGPGFVTTANTDGTDAGSSATLGQDGNITMDAVPADGTWKSVYLPDVVDGAPAAPHNRLYWLRMTPAALLDVVSFVQIRPMLVQVADGAGDADAGHFRKNIEYTLDLDRGQFGALESWAISGGDSALRITWVKH